MKKKQERDREHAIKSYLKGESITAIAQKLGYGRPWVYKRIERYQDSGEANHWQADQPRRSHGNRRQLPGEVVEAVKQARAPLHNQSLFCGGQANTLAWETLQ